jgi:hypothetical protein
MGIEIERRTAGWGERVRIVWAIAAKDIVDALKNRTILSVVLRMATLMFSAQAFPALLKLSATPRAVVYDAGNPPESPSRLLVAMAEEGTYRLST